MVWYEREIGILEALDLDPAIPILKPLYSPSKIQDARDPICMVRSLILMTLLQNTGITKWVEKTRSTPIIAILCGFEPGTASDNRPPGVGTYYDFMKRIIDGPYEKPCRCKDRSKERVRPSQYTVGPHLRNLKEEKKSRENDLDPNHSQSEKLVQKLLENPDGLRPQNLYQILEDLHIRTSLIPTIRQGLITNEKNLVVSGDGSILETAASGAGKPACTCRPDGISPCQHGRHYSSPTAKWCYDHHKDTFVFGDRYYHLVVTQNGHDFPLLTWMPGGNESDYTLSLTAFDRFLKATRENGLDVGISAFCGDGHHDACAHYNYFGKKNVLPIIPLSRASQNAWPHLSDDSATRLDKDGTPLCPAGKRMRHHGYNGRRKMHVYNCPAKRNTHRNGKSLYVFHSKDCPRQQDCEPESSLGPCIYLKSESDPRLFPPLPRDSQKFKDLMKQRSAAERCNFINDAFGLKRSSRNADYGIIRLTLANIAHHAVLRWKTSSKQSPRALSSPQLSAGAVPEADFEYQASG